MPYFLPFNVRKNCKRNYWLCWRSTRNGHIVRRQLIVLYSFFFLDPFWPATFFVRFQFLPKWIRRTIYNKPNKPDNFPYTWCGLVRRGQNPFWRDKHVRCVFISLGDAFSFFFTAELPNRLEFDSFRFREFFLILLLLLFFYTSISIAVNSLKSRTSAEIPLVHTAPIVSDTSNQSHLGRMILLFLFFI